MKQLREFIVSTLVGRLLVVAPIYLVVLLLLKAMHPWRVLCGQWQCCSQNGYPPKSPLSAPRLDSLFPHRCRRPHPGRARGPGANREVPIREDPRLRTL